MLDPALLRPGRFDRQVFLDLPDARGRVAILAVHLRGKPLEPGFDPLSLARLCVGFSGADLANLVNEAAIKAARANRLFISGRDFSEAFERILSGPTRPSRVMSPQEKRIIAYHESGHAIVGHLLPNADPVAKVSITARGRALGFTRSNPTEDRYLTSRSQLEDRIAVALAGEAAERLVFGYPTTGSSDDI